MEPIEALAARLRSRGLSPVELAKRCLERIDALDGTFHAFVDVDAEAALDAARTAEREIAAGSWRGPLHGIPYGVKDLCDARGMCTTGGSRILKPTRATEDSAVVARLRAAGAVLIGKTNLHELAFGPLGTNPHFGDTRNPWDAARHSGGSSGGSAAAVATEMCVFAIGSDTTGSIRIPASFCGVVGLKPTYGSVDGAGCLPLAWSLDHFGPMTRFVEDAALVFRELTDRGSAAAQTARTIASPLSVGVLLDFVEDAAADVARCFDEALAALAKLGCVTVDVRLRDASLIGPAAAAIVHVEALAAHGPRIADRTAELAPDVCERFELAALVSAVEYVNAQRVRRLLMEDVAVALHGCDVLVCPTEPIGAPRLDEPAVAGRRGLEPKASVVTRFTRLFNLTGHPAITVPCGLDEAAMPVGLQFAARHHDEAALFHVAAQFERATGWHAQVAPAVAGASDLVDGSAAVE
jgi:aspartyl-tRNA(Asn)/glutamyl-tRNA(Gln) amidotransferase subunit A